MARWAPAKQDVFDDFATEILHNYGTGRWLVAVDGRAGAGQGEIADGIAEAIRRSGGGAERASFDSFSPGASADAFRADVVLPFRAGEGDAILVVDGSGLLQPPLSSVFIYSIWIGVAPEGAEDRSTGQLDYERSFRPRVAATANLDNGDPEHPRRTFSDSC
ncbi:hypothetical protein [Naasia lichenicola]|uniref:Uridine kinase n=1 Tax=Naasia lichenicola TaxID=2565933 RepID=A0A4S4FR56_9MICO|nr:hypothetical protein [Naasia lichenicola]THG32382.1 hypothetical protein E6C64_05030 [Naasia lichenicola]